MLGDIYRAQGRIEKAVSSYSYALQFNPDDRVTEKKLTDLIGKNVYGKKRVSGADVAARIQKTAAYVVGFVITLWLMVLLHSHPGRQILLLRLIDSRSLWSWNLIGYIAAASAVVGVILSANGILDHPDDELVFESGSGIGFIPTGFLAAHRVRHILRGGGCILSDDGLGSDESFPVGSYSVCWGGCRGACVPGVWPEARVQVLLFGGISRLLAMLIGMVHRNDVSAG